MNKTGILLLVLMIFLTIYDFYAYVVGGDYSTISRVIKDSGAYAPALLLTIGYLLGHFFSPLPCSCNKNVN